MHLSAVLGHPDQPDFPHPPPYHSPPYPPPPFPPAPKKKSPSQLRCQERRQNNASIKSQRASKESVSSNLKEAIKINKRLSFGHCPKAGPDDLNKLFLVNLRSIFSGFGFGCRVLQIVKLRFFGIVRKNNSVNKSVFFIFFINNRDILVFFLSYLLVHS